MTSHALTGLQLPLTHQALGCILDLEFMKITTFYYGIYEYERPKLSGPKRCTSSYHNKFLFNSIGVLGN